MNEEKDILRWFNGELTTEEIKALYPNKDFNFLEKSAFYSKQLEVPIIDPQVALKDFKSREIENSKGKVVPLNFRSFLKIAAIFLIMLTSSYFLLFNNNKTYTTDVAERTSFLLPDDSEVVLNTKSKLSFNKRKWEDNRDLELDGEAFFKVMKGERFTVNTNQGTVEVLGTQFNVKERRNFFEVQCYEGSVRVKDKSNTVILASGESYRTVNGKVVQVDDFSFEKPTWLEAETTFNRVPLWQVIEELERQYNIKITTNNIDTEELYTGGFTHKNKKIAIESVTIPLNISYEIKDNIVEFYNYEAN